MKKWNRAVFISLGAFAAVAGVLPSARADLTTTTETRVMGEDGRTNVYKETKYLRENVERIDAEENIGTVKQTETTLNLCEKDQQIKYDPKFKIYKVAPLPTNPKPAEKVWTDAEKVVMKTGSVVSTMKLEPLGEQVIAGIQTHGFRMTSKSEWTGCGEKLKMPEMDDFQIEIWFSDIEPILSCLSKKQGVPLEMPQGGMEIKDGCKITYEFKGDVELMKENTHRLVMKTKTSQEGKNFSYTQEITGVSTFKLDDEVFAVPAFSKEVGEDEYKNARQQSLSRDLAETRVQKAADEKAAKEAQEKGDAEKAP